MSNRRSREGGGRSPLARIAMSCCSMEGSFWMSVKVSALDRHTSPRPRNIRSSAERVSRSESQSIDRERNGTWAVWRWGPPQWARRSCWRRCRQRIARGPCRTARLVSAWRSAFRSTPWHRCSSATQQHHPSTVSTHARSRTLTHAHTHTTYSTMIVIVRARTRVSSR